MRIIFFSNDSTAMKKILLVEDTAHLAEEIADILRMEGFHTVIGNHSSHAVELLNTIQFDLVITDILMPGMDGFELIQYIRSKEQLKSIPIIILSSKASEQDKAQGRSVGANAFLLKPCKIKELLVVVHHYLPKDAVVNFP